MTKDKVKTCMRESEEKKMISIPALSTIQVATTVFIKKKKCLILQLCEQSELTSTNTDLNSDAKINNKNI